MDINDFIPPHPKQPQVPQTAYSIVGRQIANKLRNLDEMQIPIGYQYYVPRLNRPTVTQHEPQMPGFPLSAAALSPGTAQHLLDLMYPPVGNPTYIKPPGV